MKVRPLTGLQFNLAFLFFSLPSANSKLPFCNDSSIVDVGDYKSATLTKTYIRHIIVLFQQFEQ
jgi:hypothetical protein